MRHDVAGLDERAAFEFFAHDGGGAVADVIFRGREVDEVWCVDGPFFLVVLLALCEELFDNFWREHGDGAALWGAAEDLEHFASEFVCALGCFHNAACC